MDSILTALDDASLAQAIKANLYNFFRGLNPGHEIEVWHGPGLFRWRTAVSNIWFSGVLSSQPADETAAQQVQEVLAYFQRHGTRTFSWWLEPQVAIEPWAAVLEPAGFQFDDQTPGMAAVLDELPASTPQPAGLEIRRIVDLDEFQLWNDVFLRGYGFPAEMAAPFETLFAAPGTGPALYNYLGYLHGKPVVTSSLYLGAGVAGVYNVATLPEARRQGLGAALTLHTLQQARHMGYLAGILQSSTMGYRIYERLGFRKLCGMEHFFWPASQ